MGWIAKQLRCWEWVGRIAMFVDTLEAFCTGIDGETTGVDIEVTAR